MVETSTLPKTSLSPQREVFLWTLMIRTLRSPETCLPTRQTASDSVAEVLPAAEAATSNSHTMTCPKTDFPTAAVMFRRSVAMDMTKCAMVTNLTVLMDHLQRTTMMEAMIATSMIAHVVTMDVVS